jgi:selenocysteine lyase/cysteine desulfurase
MSVNPLSSISRHASHQDWEEVARLFPVNKTSIWLNNCGTTPCHQGVIHSSARFLDGYSREGIFTSTESYWDVREYLVQALADLLKCDSSELALIHNTSEGMNFISHGLSLEKGDVILLMENEYPSNVYPWEHWESKGIQLDFVPLGNTPEEFFQNVKQKWSSKVKVLSVSMVHWCTGMPLPLDLLGSFCANTEASFIVDGAQGVGMLPIDVEQYGVDYMAFPAWKWLLGPLGLGVLYVAKKKLPGLKPIFKGTSSVIRDEEYLPYRNDLKPTAERFEYSTPNFNDWVYLKSSLELLTSIGWEQVQQRISELSQYLTRGLEQRGFSCMSKSFPDQQTGIVVFEKEGERADYTRRIVEYLNKNKVIAAERLGRVRMAPHIYLLEEQLSNVLNLLEEF